MAHVVCLYHIIWRTKCSQRTITEASERELYAYILGYCKQKDCTLVRIGGMEDHIHMLVFLRPDIALSGFMQVLKTESSKWMKEHRELFPRFEGWGNGYAAFSYSERDKEMIRGYIMRQKEHHRGKSFRDEYEELLREWGIDPETDFFLRDE